MGSILSVVGDRWRDLTSAKRLALLVTVLGLVVSVGLWAYLGSQVPYESAFDNLKPADASTVVNKLKELQIPYDLLTAADGTVSIRVPSSMADEARIQVAGAGLLQGGNVGYEIFDQPSFGLSDFIQQVDYQRALEGELARSITQIDGVDTARVHLAIPQPSVFVNQQQDPSAAVILGMKPGYHIDRSEANAIVNLVAGAVQGMKQTGVVLLDTTGQLLHTSGAPAAADSGTVGDQFATQRAMELDMESRLQDLLDRVVGPGHSSAVVSLNLDWSQGQSTSETYLPNGQQPALVSSQDVVDTQSTSSTAGGIPGVTSNVPVYQATGTTPTPTGTGTPVPPAQHVEATRSYQLSKTTETTNRTPGIVSRVSVAIAVDKSVANAATIQNLTQVAQAAVGYDAKRGDTVSVVAVTMAPTTLAAPVGAESHQPMDLARIAALAAGPSIAIIVLAVLLLRRRGGRRVSDRTITVLPPMTLAQLPSGLADPAGLPVAPEARREFIREQLTNLADQHPALVASVLQAWVTEDGGGRQ